MKITELEELAQKIRSLKSEGKKTVYCHGCFDLMHIGHIKYFQAAKKMGDVLIVTVTPDIYVDKPGRPVFSQNLRAECVAALECVDYVAINRWPTAEETLRLLRPDIYVKGQEFENLEDKTGKLQKEYKVLEEIGAEMRFTHEIVFSSTKLLNQHLNPQITQINPQISQISTDEKIDTFIDSKTSEEFLNPVEKKKADKDERTYRIIGAAMEVHKEMGSGFLEAVYQEALDMEFRSQGMPYKSQPIIDIFYKEKLLEKKYQPDFICFDEIIVEIKALRQLSGTEESQIINYLKATGFKVGLLINFGAKSLEYKRFVYNESV